jgi:hypothetical protein
MIDPFDERPAPTRTLRLLGGCMLRLQQYERLLKVLLAQQDLTGDLDTLDAQQARRTRRLSGKTLGHLTRELFDSALLTPADPGGGEVPRLALKQDKLHLSLRTSLRMSEEQRAAAKAAIDELVTIRNDLVHHLLDRFDLTSDDGCAAASEHLWACHERIDEHLRTLHQWAQEMMSARVAAAQKLIEQIASGTFAEATEPARPLVDWPETSVVAAVRHGLERLGGGWVSVQALRSWLGEHHPDESPQRYGRRTWVQVLDEAKIFEVQYRPGAHGQQRNAWVRLRAPAAP